MQKEESHTDLGTIRIHKNVIASISSIAAMEINGVKRVGGNLRSGLMELIGKKGTPAINVEIDKSGDVRVNIPIIVKYGFNIPEVANKAQENVSNALEKMTNLSIRYINVNVQGVEAE